MRQFEAKKMNTLHTFRNRTALILLLTLLLASPALAAVNLYDSALNENFEHISPYWTTGEAKQAGSLNVSLSQYIPNPVQPGQEMTVFLQVSNRRGLSTGAWLEVVSEYPYTVLPTADVERAQNLKVITGSTLQFRVKVADDAKDGITPIQVRYGLSDNRNDYRKLYFDIFVRTFDPVLNIEEIKQEPAEIAPGEYGKVSITLQNHGHLILQNIATVLDLTGKFNPTTNLNNNIAMQATMNARLQEIDRRVASGESPLMGPSPVVQQEKTPGMQTQNPDFIAFTPVDSSTQKIVPELKPGESQTIVFNVQALPTAKSMIYTTPLYVNYNDKYNNPFMVQGDVGLKVNTPPDPYIALDASTLRSTFFAGDLVVKVANRGLSELRYATLKLGDSKDYQILTAPQSAYIGTLNSGEEKTATFQVIPREKGTLTFPFTLTFKDSYNQEHTQKIELSLPLVNRAYYQDIPFEWMMVWGVLGIVLVVLVAWYIRTTKRSISPGHLPPPTQSNKT